jgi:hypothetical protein
MQVFDPRRGIGDGNAVARPPLLSDGKAGQKRRGERKDQKSI